MIPDAFSSFWSPWYPVVTAGVKALSRCSPPSHRKTVILSSVTHSVHLSINYFLHIFLVLFNLLFSSSILSFLYPSFCLSSNFFFSLPFFLTRSPLLKNVYRTSWNTLLKRSSSSWSPWYPVMLLGHITYHVRWWGWAGQVWMLWGRGDEHAGALPHGWVLLHPLVSSG